MRDNPTTTDRHTNEGRERFFNGLIDEVAIYNRALGASEIQAIFQAGSAGKCKDPVTMIFNLIEYVLLLNVVEGIENSLDAKLDAAVNALLDVNENNDVAACNSLEAFINAVDAQSGKKVDQADADILILMALEILVALDCI